VQISVTPPPQMPATLEAGTIDGYSVGEPWNQAAVKKKIGVPVITDEQIFPDNPEKVFGLTEDFARRTQDGQGPVARADQGAAMARRRRGKNRRRGGEDPGAGPTMSAPTKP
jgi:ABC-type nitrate/sulfonate/bicarbonate transport system substrate-binding protein